MARNITKRSVLLIKRIRQALGLKTHYELGRWTTIPDGTLRAAEKQGMSIKLIALAKLCYVAEKHAKIAPRQVIDWVYDDYLTDRMRAEIDNAIQAWKDEQAMKARGKKKSKP